MRFPIFLLLAISCETTRVADKFELQYPTGLKPRIHFTPQET